MEKQLEFVTKHFLALSAGLSVLGTIATMVFLSGYLTVFDRSIIWIVEYSDIIKFALVAISLMGTFIALIGLAQNFIQIAASNGIGRLGGFIAFAGAISVFIIIPMIVNYRENNKPALLVGVCGLVAVIMAIVAFGYTYHFVIYSKAKKEGRFIQGSAIVGIWILFIFSLGISYGVFELAQPAQKEITVKNQTGGVSKHTNAKVIILLSHHVVFLADGFLHTVPTSDIVLIKSPPESRSPYS